VSSSWIVRRGQKLRERLKAISPEVLEAAFNTPREMEKPFRSKSLDLEIFFAPNHEVVNGWPVVLRKKIRLGYFT
jgi:hypothetical protein